MKTQELSLSNMLKKNIFGAIFINNYSKEGFVNLFRSRIKWLFLITFASILYSCNNSSLVQQYKMLHIHDSLLMVQTATNDSTIKSYINDMNEIQSNLDEITSREKILSVKGEGIGNNAVEDIKAIDKLIIKSNREIAALHLKIHKMGAKDAEMETMMSRMTQQLEQKDSEIALLQSSLVKANDSYTEITRQFNDSIAVLQEQNARIGYLTNSMNIVYYAIGTVKELKNSKVITKTGGFIGIGQNTKLTPDNNTAYFTKTDMTKLNAIPLNAKFKKLYTTHPVASYKITGDKRVDSLIITDPVAFWSEEKYLIIAVK